MAENEKLKFNPNELSGRLYKAQGFLTLQCTVPRRPGDIIRGAGTFAGTSQIPLRVLRPATALEFIRQHKLAAKMCGSPTDFDPAEVMPFFYRVEAAD